MSKQYKLRCIKKVKPGVVVGGETWAMTEMDMKRVGIWERKILRKIYGLLVEQGI